MKFEYLCMYKIIQPKTIHTLADLDLKSSIRKEGFWKEWVKRLSKDKAMWKN